MCVNLLIESHSSDLNSSRETSDELPTEIRKQVSVADDCIQVAMDDALGSSPPRCRSKYGGCNIVAANSVYFPHTMYANS